MAKEKTVVLFVRHWDEAEGKDYIFTEATEVGETHHFKTPSAFINEFSALYRRNTNFDSGFRIVDVKIG